MAKIKKTVRVFYSWQSDSPKKTNLNAIRHALGKACTQLGKAYPKLKLVPDEATRDTSGAPNIALKILEKIEDSAIFIADITTVTPPGPDRPCPNPNVGYELGYAVATLGWERIILLFNEAIGVFPADLPFDFVQHRASPYSYAETDTTEKRTELAKFLEGAIKTVIEKNPKRPAELKGLSREKIEHDHDVENMRWLMQKIHIPTLQGHIDELPRRVTDRAMWFHDHFRGVAENALFSVYDPVLQQAVTSLKNGWNVALSHGAEYHGGPGGKAYFFSNPGDAALSTSQQVAWDAIEAARADMASGLTTILARLREAYLEIKITKTNERAWNDYVAFESEFSTLTSPKPGKKKGGTKK